MKLSGVSFLVSLLLVATLAAPTLSQQSQGSSGVGSPSQAGTGTIPATQPTPPGTIIPEGTAVQIELQDNLKSGATPMGTTVHFVVFKAVSSPLGILIPSGAPAYGQITESKKAGMFGQSGKLSFTCDYLVLPNGTQVPLRSQEVSNHGGDSRGASVVAAILLTPFALFANGGNARAHKGQQYTMYVDRDTTIAPATTTATDPPATGTKSLFVLANGGQVVGSLTAFDGQTYTVSTSVGDITLKTSDVKAVYAITNDLPPATSASSSDKSPVAPAPSSQSAIDTSYIGTDKHVIVNLANGDTYYGIVTQLAGSVYTLATREGPIQIKATDIKSVQYPDK